MAESLGSLCDKLTIINLKHYHSTDAARLESLEKQRQQLSDEIDEYVRDAQTGKIKSHQLTFAANKVYDKTKFHLDKPEGSLGHLFFSLASANCELWHEQEKVYNFENIANEDKATLLGKLAQLNLKRNACIDSIDASFAKVVLTQQNS
jgi:hypothetical protein